MGKKQKVMIGVLGIVIVLIMIITIMALKNKGEDVGQVEVPKVEEVDGETVGEDIEVEEDIENENEEEKEEEEKIYGYDNKVLGLRFNFDDRLYIKESTDELYNKIKAVAKEGENFDTTKDIVPEVINIVKATTGEADGVVINVAIMPFELGEVQENKEEEPKQVSEILGNEVILEKYDKQLETKITEQGGEIGAIEPSYIDERGYLISERQYTDKEGKLVEVKQAIIPAGVNAVVVTMVSDGRPLEYSKEEIFNEIIESVEIDIPEEQQEEVKQEEVKQEEVKKEEVKQEESKGDKGE